MQPFKKDSSRGARAMLTKLQAEAVLQLRPDEWRSAYPDLSLSDLQGTVRKGFAEVRYERGSMLSPRTGIKFRLSRQQPAANLYAKARAIIEAADAAPLCPKR